MQPLLWVVSKVNCQKNCNLNLKEKDNVVGMLAQDTYTHGSQTMIYTSKIIKCFPDTYHLVMSENLFLVRHDCQM